MKNIKYFPVILTAVLGVAMLLFLHDFHFSNEFEGFKILFIFISWPIYFLVYFIAAIFIRKREKTKSVFKIFLRSFIVFCIFAGIASVKFHFDGKAWIVKKHQEFEQRNKTQADYIANINDKIKKDPNNAVLLTNRGKYNVSRFHKHKEAILDYEMAISLDPGYVKAYQELGYVLMVEKRFDDAIVLYKGILKKAELQTIKLSQQEKDFFLRSIKDYEKYKVQ